MRFFTILHSTRFSRSFFRSNFSSFWHYFIHFRFYGNRNGFLRLIDIVFDDSLSCSDFIRFLCFNGNRNNFLWFFGLIFDGSYCRGYLLLLLLHFRHNRHIFFSNRGAFVNITRGNTGRSLPSGKLILDLHRLDFRRFLYFFYFR